MWPSIIFKRPSVVKNTAVKMICKTCMKSQMLVDGSVDIGAHFCTFSGNAPSYNPTGKTLDPKDPNLPNGAFASCPLSHYCQSVLAYLLNGARQFQLYHGCGGMAGNM